MGKLTGKIKAGSILLSIWSNEAKVDGKIMEIPNITISRIYMDKEKKWAFGNQFRPTDMPHILEVINKYQNNEFDQTNLS